MDGTPEGEGDLPEALVEGLNLGLASGEWDEVLDLFAEHGTLVVDRGSRTAFEGPSGILDALEGLREDLEGVQYASSPPEEEGEDGLASDLLAASGPDAPPGRLHLDLTPDREVREAVLELDPTPPDEPGPPDR